MVYLIERRNHHTSEIGQKDESQNGSNKKTKHTNFFLKNEHLLLSVTHTYNVVKEIVAKNGRSCAIRCKSMKLGMWLI